MQFPKQNYFFCNKKTTLVVVLILIKTNLYCRTERIAKTCKTYGYYFTVIKEGF